MNAKHTDLALEAAQILRDADKSAGEIEGACVTEKRDKGFLITEVKITSEKAAKELCKPTGDYITIDIQRFLKRSDGAFADAVEVIGGVISGLFGEKPPKSTLVAGLGNRAVTPDIVGPKTADMVLATRHLLESAPEEFPFFNKVSVISPGVIGTTGLDSGELIRSAFEIAKPEAVLVIDALCSSDPNRLCKTVQITNTGIVPGSGVGNAGSEISSRTMGVPVIAVGAPTVMSLHSAAEHYFGSACGGNEEHGEDMFVTPKDIDIKAEEISKLIAYGINFALHNGLSVSDIDMLV